VTAGREFLARKDLIAASRVFMAAKGVLGDTDVLRDVLEKTMALGVELAETSVEFRELEKDAALLEDPEAALILYEGFVRKHPGFAPAVERSLELAGECEDPSRIGRGVLELGKSALLREDFGGARQNFRFVVECEPENDEALLYLASMNPPGSDVPRDVLGLRLHLLKEEKIYDAALHLARKSLEGRQEDIPLNELLVALCEVSGKDPFPYLVNLGQLAMEREEHDQAKKYFEMAVSSSETPDLVVDVLTETPDIGDVFTRMELARLRSEASPDLLSDPRPPPKSTPPTRT
jgi:tetratricopeptide (TPR) repeat protein